jgi:hypothetical protein
MTEDQRPDAADVVARVVRAMSSRRHSGSGTPVHAM